MSSSKARRKNKYSDTPHPNPKKPTCTIELAHEMAATIAKGVPLNATARAHGISPWTFKDWLDRGKGTAPTSKASKELYREFYEIINAARAKLVEKTVEAVVSDADWRAKAWYLERTEREEFGKHEPQVVINAAQLPAGATPVDVVAELVERKKLPKGE